MRRGVEGDSPKLHDSVLSLILSLLHTEVEDGSGDLVSTCASPVLAWLAKEGAHWRTRVGPKERKDLWTYLARSVEKGDDKLAQQVLDLLRQALGRVLEGKELVEEVGALVDQRTAAHVAQRPGHMQGLIMALELLQSARAAAPQAPWFQLLSKAVALLEATLTTKQAKAGPANEDEGTPSFSFLCLGNIKVYA